MSELYSVVWHCENNFILFPFFLAYWVAEDKDVPARVCILDMPSRNELRVKNLFNVANCNMHWQVRISINYSKTI